MYLVVTINEGGYIRPEHGYDWGDIIHRETRDIDVEYRNYCERRLADAAPLAFGKRAVAELDENGGVCALWVKDSARPWWAEKLKIWNGCYGSWPLRETNH